jgi:ribosomal protein S18 acetylase RimI-like enzyme
MAVSFREAKSSDIAQMTLIRASEWGSTEFWENRIAGYLNRRQSPRYALAGRVCYVAVSDNAIIGFAAGHLTRRYECEGEVQWINVVPEWRRRSVASELLRLLGKWFVEQGAFRVCVDVEPSNVAARAFYRRHGASDLRPPWLVWDDIRQVVGHGDG